MKYKKDKKHKKDKKDKKENNAIPWQVLMQAADENEANIVEALLKSEHIPVVKKYREIGEYLMIYMGMTNLGIDILVPADQVEKAQHVLALDDVDGEEDLD
ncbi:MAG: DUF2007 domain-containing protein [Peptococcaceae bacterium]|nr:DUF2007 domain-containing protein [Peptococcaceae bacterium]